MRVVEKLSLFPHPSLTATSRAFHFLTLAKLAILPFFGAIYTHFLVIPFDSERSSAQSSSSYKLLPILEISSATRVIH
jgi:hypothetical protein